MFKWLSLCLAVALLASTADAGEFGNLLDNDVEQASRDASSKALDGIIRTFEALKKRELKNVGGSNESLLAASQALREAAGQMRKIEKFSSASRNITESAFGESVTNRTATLAQALGSPPPKTLLDLYRVFTVATDHLAATLEAAAKRANPTDQSILRTIGPELTRYIELGDTVSEVARNFS